MQSELQHAENERIAEKMKRAFPRSETNEQGGKGGGVPTKTTPTPMG